ncbi:hypothetical protein KCU94_g84, partial [Aureobasidium melanogenum]
MHFLRVPRLKCQQLFYLISAFFFALNLLQRMFTTLLFSLILRRHDETISGLVGCDCLQRGSALIPGSNSSVVTTWCERGNINDKVSFRASCPRSAPFH